MEVDVAFFDTEGAPAVVGFARQTKVYQGGREIERSFYGLDGELMVEPDYKFARQTRAYNSDGRLSEEAFYDESLNLIVSCEGYAKVKYSYDNRGNKTDVSYFGADGQFMAYGAWDGWSGVARMVFEYNEHGQTAVQYLFGGDGKLLPRCAITSFSYDSKGSERSRSLFDRRGIPVPHDDYKTQKRRFQSRFLEWDRTSDE
jgi:hypothetical protein